MPNQSAQPSATLHADDVCQGYIPFRAPVDDHKVIDTNGRNQASADMTVDGGKHDVSATIFGVEADIP